MKSFLLGIKFLIDNWIDDESVANICAVQVSTVGVTGTRANVSGKVQSLLQDIKKVCNCTILI